MLALWLVLTPGLLLGAYMLGTRDGMRQAHRHEIAADRTPWPCILTANHEPHIWFPQDHLAALCQGRNRKPRSKR